MALKRYRVEAEIPQLIAHHVNQVAEVQASNEAVAVYRALKVIRSRPEMKGRHIKFLKLQIFVQGPNSLE